MPSLTILPEGTVLDYTADDRTLLQILLDHSLVIDSPCGGMGTCGKCRVRLVAGDPPPASDDEARMLGREALDQGIRLACMVEPAGDLAVDLIQSDKVHKVLTTGYVPDFTPAPSVTKRLCAIPRATLEEQTPFEDRLAAAAGVDQVDWRLLRDVEEQETMTAVLYDGVLMGLEPGDTTAAAYGIAVDIGTTTVVVALVDLSTGEEVAAASAINPQKAFGLDVLTRITYQQEHRTDGAQKLQAAIVDSLNAMIGEVCNSGGIGRESVYEICVSANCTMLHMLLGVDATGIGASPYAPRFTRSKTLRATDIGLRCADFARLYCLPSVSAYIGADIVSGAYVCGLHGTADTVLFIDIGTNGEIVLAHEGRLLSCSCAAGPALEGMNISSGMRAATGAVEDVAITERGVRCKTIGGEAPAGICGSGILAAVKELLRVGLVRRDGAFLKKEQLAADDYRHPMLLLNGRKREFLLCRQPRLLITQGDVRQVQLAKGAILSGFLALLGQAGIAMEDLSRVLIAGQFGAHLPVDSLVGAGILPPQVADRLEYVGNASKTGAYLALLSARAKAEMESLAHRMEYLELSATEGYERLFADCLQFPASAREEQAGTQRRARNAQ